MVWADQGANMIYFVSTLGAGTAVGLGTKATMAIASTGIGLQSAGGKDVQLKTLYENAEDALLKLDALNEEYRKAVDAPLREMSEKASEGTRGGVQPQIPEIGVPSGSAAREIEKLIKEAQRDQFAIDSATSPEGGITVAKGLEEYGVTLADTPADPTEVETPTEEGLTEGQEAFTKIASTLGSILAQELINPLDEDPDPMIRAVKPKPFKTKQIRPQRIGMQDGGSTVLNRKMFIGGGEVDGPGGPKEDLVPIWASDKEYVVSHKGVKRMGGGDFDKGIAALDRINFGK